MRKVRLLNVDVDDLTMEDLLDVRRGQIMTMHVDSLARLQKDREFYDLLGEFDVITCDSQILVWAARALGTPLRERVSGSDYFPQFYRRYAQDESVTIFLLGGMGDISRRAADKINAIVGRTMVVGALGPEMGFEDRPDEMAQIRETIASSGATVLVLGIAAGRQEKLIHRERPLMPSVELWLPLGGTVDYEAGDVVRPPAWVTSGGMEWLWRLVREPRRRWRRYLVHQPPVLWRLLQQRSGRYRNPFGPGAASSRALADSAAPGLAD